MAAAYTPGYTKYNDIEVYDKVNRLNTRARAY